MFVANTKYLCRTSPKWSSKISKYFQCIFLRHVHFEMHETYFYQFLLRSIWIWFRLCVIFRRRLPFEICSDSIKILENIARKKQGKYKKAVLKEVFSHISSHTRLIKIYFFSSFLKICRNIKNGKNLIYDFSFFDWNSNDIKCIFGAGVDWDLMEAWLLGIPIQLHPWHHHFGKKNLFSICHHDHCFQFRKMLFYSSRV